MEYLLKVESIRPNGVPITEEITVQEVAKEDFKKMMNWNEKKFKENTIKRTS